jgi:DnaJ family protein C protein 28
MDFKDWRKASDTPANESEKAKPNKYRGKQYRDYIEEQIHEAQKRGEFDNLPGAGKPLNLDDGSYAGDRALGYSLLKSNGYAPREVELSKEIRTAAERAEVKLAKVRHQGQALRSRRVPPFPSEKRAFNASLEKALTEYERTLHSLNSRILTLNLSAPVAMHIPMFEVEQRVQQFRDSCPPFTVL